ncbi:MAG TPA: LamG domain-containing protein, partial [Planctomycetota bacterium]|nr:LamG domain-containing protein [Planctomycetota bacterium]
MACLLLACLAIAAQDPAGYWSFDEGSGSAAFDESGHNATGTLVGDVQWRQGRLGQGLYFPGANGAYVDIPDGDWNRGAPLTFLCWVKNGFEEREHPPGVLLSHQERGESGLFGLTLNGGNYLGFAVWDATHLERKQRKEDPERSVGEAIQDVDWVHLAFTIGEKELKYYKNGELRQTRAVDAFPASRGRLYVGSRGPAGDLPFKGWIDELAVFDRVLPPAEIRSIYSAYRGGAPLLAKSAPDVVYVAAEKLFYSPGERGNAKVVVKNFSAQPREARLSVRVRTLLETDREIHAETLKLEPRGRVARDVPLTFSGESHGAALLASLDGGSPRESPPFAVSDN